MSTSANKVPLSLDKRQWHPSVLPGHIVLVSTVGSDGQENIAPKSWVTMASARRPAIAFGCNTTHTTYQNIRASETFVVNIPDASLAERIWKLPRDHGAERISHSGFTLAPAQKVGAPIVTECRAHLECVYDGEKAFSDEVMVFGRIVAASIDAGCLEGSPAQQYFRLRPAFFLEEALFGTIDGAQKVGGLPTTDHPLFVINMGEPARPGAAGAVLKDHAAFLIRLRSEGRLLMAGAFGAEGPEGGSGGGGMYVVSAPSREEAELVANEDPLAHAGADFAVRAWRRSF